MPVDGRSSIPSGLKAGWESRNKKDVVRRSFIMMVGSFAATIIMKDSSSKPWRPTGPPMAWKMKRLTTKNLFPGEQIKG